MKQRTQAVSLRQIFPRLGELRIELSFSDVCGRAHSPQLRVLYPAARAFFRFACVRADCSGDYDLDDAITTLLNSTPQGIRSVRGTLICDGVRPDRLRDGATCSIRLEYQLTSTSAEA